MPITPEQTDEIKNLATAMRVAAFREGRDVDGGERIAETERTIRAFYEYLNSVSE